ncbi:MAG TPA: hypothetical protein VK917_05435 [Ilumatobacter sp.]|nr:hypothetical protein [Ilumatobacter sp.]
MWRWLGIPWLVRRWAFRRGVRSQNDLVHFIALVVIGRAAFLRRNARIKGVYGREPVWLVLSGLFFAKDLVERLTVKDAEVVTTETLRAGDRIQISPIAPSTRSSRRAAST